MTDTERELVYPGIKPYEKDTCPECAGEPSNVEIYDISVFDDGYLPDVDQSEVYYACDDCGTEWRYVDPEN